MTVPQRRAAMEQAYQYSVIVVNFELVSWWFREYGLKLAKLGIDGLFVDELSRLKAARGTGFKALRPRLKNFKWRVGVTGTPVAEDLEGLFGQMMVIDDGKVFGKNRMKFLQEHFVPTDYDQHQWAVRDSHVRLLLDAVAPYVHVVPDYTHTLPPLHITPHWVDMSPGGRAAYQELGAQMVIEGEEITAVNAGVLSGKLQQAASGFVYRDMPDAGPDDREEGDRVKLPPLDIHEAKWLKLMELIALNPEPSMLIYWFLYQKDVLSRYGEHLSDPGVLDRWNHGEVDLMLAHPKSCGHGLNLQFGGHRQIWCGPIWPNDLWNQTIARLWRRGQTEEVHIDVVCTRDSIDEVIMARLEGKQQWHEMFIEHMRTF